MAAITTTDALVAALRAPVAFLKTLPAVSAGNWASTWTTAGNPGAGATPGAAALASSATAGALPLPALTGVQDVFLASLKAAGPQALTLQLIDRLAHNGNLNGALATAQTVGTPALDARYADSIGNQVALEVYAAMGATSTTATISYTNQAGTAARTGTAAIAANLPAGRVVPVTLAAGDTGVRSVESVTLAASTGGGGFGVTLYRVVAQLGVAVPNVSAGEDFAQLGLPDIGTGGVSSACLSFYVLPSAATAGTLVGALTPAVN